MSKDFFLNKLMVLLFFSVFFLSPFGLNFSGNSVLFPDIVRIFVVVTFSYIFIRFGFVYQSFNLTFPLFFLLLFVTLEVVLPIVGVVFWGPSSVSSSIRALLYWLPVLLLGYFLITRQWGGEKWLNKLFIFGLIINLAVALIEFGVYFYIIPDFLNPRYYLKYVALSDGYLNSSFRASGIFTNSTGLAVFAYLATIHFMAKALETKLNSNYIFYIFVGLVLIIFSTSRVPLLAAFISIFIFLVFYRKTLDGYFLKAIGVFVSLGVIYLLFNLDIPIFSRFSRLEAGLKEDYSLGMRLFVLWPAALEFYQGLGHPTFTTPTKFVGTIDSGYLTYLLQGGLVFLILSFTLTFSIFLYGFYRAFIKKQRLYVNYYSMFFSLYVLLGMVTSNPLRNSIVIVFLCVLVFSLSSQRNRIS